MSSGNGDMLRLALPSKGRLLQPTFDFLESCGFRVKSGGQGARDYTAQIPSLPHCTVDLMAASEIPQRLRTGEAHLGVTGIDLIAELYGATPASIESPAERLPDAPLAVRLLGFGHANLVVAVPRAWIDVDTMSDIAEVANAYRRRHGRRMRIATKYKGLTRSYFSDHNVTDCRIIRSDGATEAAPAAGVADIIVDITSTGQTLQANHLKSLRDSPILASQATLFITGSSRAAWGPNAVASLKRLLDMIDAKVTARRCKMLFSRLPPSGGESSPSDMTRRLAELERSLSGRILSIMSFLEGPNPYANHVSAQGLSVRITAPDTELYKVVTTLRGHGAMDIVVQDTDYVFDGELSSFEQASAALGF